MLAVLDGEVKYVGEEPNAFGKLLLIKHAENHITVYAHLESTRVVAGASVKKALIGTVVKVGERSRLNFSFRCAKIVRQKTHWIISLWPGTEARFIIDLKIETG